MSLDQLLQATLPPRLEEDKPVSPTLLVGIGGTGKEVLLRFRRLVVERYGSLSMLPFLQFMHLDTDATATAKEQYDLRGTDDPISAEVKLKPTERIELKVDGGTGKYVEHINSYPQIKRWFPAGGKIAGLGDLGDGAGQIRLASRLGFFHPPNFRNINARIEQCKGLLRDASIMKRSSGLGFEFNPQGMNIFVIASLAGGTGSGTFLDMGFLLQRHFPSAERIGILLLPSFFTDYAGGERVRANGYAALMELNHYSFGHSFQADWDGSRIEHLPPPPFTNTYLIDGVNEARLVIGSSGKEYDAYKMIAEALFQDFSIGKFAGMKRATRINLVNFNLNVYTHNFLNETLRSEPQGTNRSIVGDTYPTRFGSFGLAAISFPTDRLQNSCAARLATSILDFWQKSVLDNPLEKLFTTVLAHEDVRFAQGRLELRDGSGIIDRQDVEDELLVFDSGSSRTFPSHFWQKAQTIRTELEAAPSGQKAAVLAQHRSQLEQFLAKEDSDNPDDWGMGIRQVESNMRAYLARVKAGIEKRAADLAGDPHLGVAYTLSLLRELKSLLRSEQFPYLLHFEAQIPDWRDEIQRHTFALDQVQMEIARHERQWLFRSEDLKRDLEKLVGDEGSDDLGVLYQYLVARIMKQVCKRGKQICEEIDQFLGKDDPTGKGLLGRYYTLLAGFGRLKDRLRSKERYFAKPEKSELTISLYREEDFEEWYRRWVGQPQEEAEILRTIGNQILKEVFLVDSVTAALDYVQKTSIDDIESRMLGHCKAYLASREEQPEALSLLFESNRFSKAQREEMVRRAYNLAKVWLARSERGLEHTGLPPVRADQRPCLIGVDSSNPSLLQELKSLIGEIQVPGDSPPSFLGVGSHNRGTIIFYNELGGVPAFYPSSVTSPNGLRKAYDVYTEKDELHIDKNRFQFGDLIPKTNEEARRYADSLKAFVLARLLGLLKVREIRDDSEHPTFHYSYWHDSGLVTEEVRLGSEMNAVDFLFRDARPEHHTHRHHLLRQVEDAVEELQDRRLLWAYSLLIEFYLKKVYPPVTGHAAGLEDLTITQYSPEHAVLALARTRLHDLLPDPEDWKRLSQEIDGRRGKPRGEELSYDEFVAALAPYCKVAGKFPERTVSPIGAERVVYRDVLSLDLAKIAGSRERDRKRPQPRSAVLPPDKPVERVAERPCPRCNELIDARATFCRHCRNTVAQRIPCPHCGEPNVPSDLEYCWKCGGRMQETEKLDCPRCFGFRGYPSDFPCPVCSYTPGDDLSAVEEAPSREPMSSPTFYEPADGNGASGSPVPPEIVTRNTVECPICYSTVQAGPRCSVCDGLLEAH